MGGLLQRPPPLQRLPVKAWGLVFCVLHRCDDPLLDPEVARSGPRGATKISGCPKALRSTRRQLSAVWVQSPRLLCECQTATAFQHSTCREECTSSRRCVACCLHCLTWPQAASSARDRHACSMEHRPTCYSTFLRLSIIVRQAMQYLQRRSTARRRMLQRWSPFWGLYRLAT